MTSKALRVAAAALAALALFVAALIVGAHRDEVRLGGARDISLGELWVPAAILGTAVVLWFAAPWLVRRQAERRREKVSGRTNGGQR